MSVGGGAGIRLDFPEPAGVDDLTPALPAERGIALRPATTADLPFLRTLYASTRMQELVGVPWPIQVVQDFVDNQFALQHQHYLASYPGARFWVIKHRRQPVGRYYLHRAENIFLIVDISLVPQSRGQGIGTLLIEHTLRQAALADAEVRLHVHHGNHDAQRLYARLGFRVAQEAGSHLAMRWTPPLS